MLVACPAAQGLGLKVPTPKHHQGPEWEAGRAQVPLEPPADAPGKTVSVVCWGWTGNARDEGDAAAAWLSDALGLPVRLVRYIGELLCATHVIVKLVGEQRWSRSSELAHKRLRMGIVHKHAHYCDCP